MRHLRDGNSEHAAAGAALITVILWASAFVGIRSAGHHFDAAPLALGRLVVGVIALGFLTMARRPPLPKRRDLLPLILCGALWFGIYNIALNASERRIDAGTAAMLVSIGPLLIALLAAVVLHEPLSGRLVAGCVVALAGVVVIGVAGHGGSVSTVGAILCLAAACAYSTAVVIQKGVLRRVSALQATFLSAIAGLCVCLPWAPRLLQQVREAPAGSLVWLIYLGLFPTAIAFTTWAYALARTQAARLGASTYLVPPISVLLGFVLLGEAPAAWSYVGGLLCLSGVALSRSRRGASSSAVSEPAVEKA